MHFDTNLNLKAMGLCCEREQQIIFSHLSFDVSAGEMLLIEGPNGAGKSSLLQLLAGLMTPFSGEIHWQNTPIHEQHETYVRNLHYMGHTNGIKLGLTVIENLRMACELALAPLSLTTLSSVLSLLQLDKQQMKLAKNLSAGQKRRIALARLILIPKPLWILDEPLTSLDSATQMLVLQLLKTHSESGGISLISSHQPIQLDEINIKTLRLSAC